MNFSVKMKLCIFILLLIVSDIDVRKIARVDRVYVCKCVPNCVITDFENTVIHRRRESSIVNSKFTLLWDIKKVKIVVNVQRCRNSETLDTCENFGALKIPNACDYLRERNSVIGNLIASISPPYKCPFKKGTYVQKNATLDGSAFPLFPLDGWYWKFSSDYYNYSDNKFLWSFCFQGGVYDLH